MQLLHVPTQQEVLAAHVMQVTAVTVSLVQVTVSIVDVINFQLCVL